MNSTVLATDSLQLQSEKKGSKRFYIGLPLLFYFGSIIPMLFLVPFYSLEMLTNLDPYCRLIGVAIWLIVGHRLLRPGEAFVKGQDWKLERKNIIFGILSGLVLLPVFLGFASLFDMSKLISRVSFPDWISSLILLWLVNSFVTPLGEELLWRGILWNRLAKNRSQIVTLILTSVAFGLAHIITDGTYVRVPAIILFGLACGLVRMRWGLTACYATHAVANFFAGAMAFFPGHWQKVMMFLGL